MGGPLTFNAVGAILVGSILVNNFVLAQFLGICPFLGVSKEVKPAVGMSVAVTAVMVLATAVTWPIDYYILGEDYRYLRTLVFILVIAALVQLVEIILKRYMPSLYDALGVYLPLITTNCAVLGVAMLNVENNYGYGASLINSFGAGVGFLLAMVLFAGVRGQLRNATPSKSFEGIPLTLISASIVSLSFLGFSGVVNKLFGV